MERTLESTDEWLQRHGIFGLSSSSGGARGSASTLSLCRNAQLFATVSHPQHGTGQLTGWLHKGQRYGSSSGITVDGQCRVAFTGGDDRLLPAAELSLLGAAGGPVEEAPQPVTVPPLTLPLCAELFLRYPLVPGRGVACDCPPLWVRLVECLGIAVRMPLWRHARWEQGAGIQGRSRYVPTILLFALRNATALRRLQSAELLGREAMRELISHLTEPTPLAQGQGEDRGLLCPETMTKLCGPAAGALTARLRDITLQYRNAKDRIDIAEFSLLLHSESTALERLKRNVEEKGARLRSKAEADMRCVAPLHLFEAAQSSLPGVDFRKAAGVVSRDFAFDQALVYSKEEAPDGRIIVHGLRTDQLVVVGLIQLCASLSLMLQPPRHPDEADGLVPVKLPHPSLRPPTLPDRLYWEELASLEGEELIYALPPFHGSRLLPSVCTCGSKGAEG
eukprot:Hpha_TRINITY_DN390_c0_g1::TRINITY_DN390_c0_g1_i1::g.112707::m.112707